jgi:hypothetical protein
LLVVDRLDWYRVHFPEALLVGLAELVALPVVQPVAAGFLLAGQGCRRGLCLVAY